MRPYSVRIFPYVFILALIFSRMPAVAQMRQIYLDTDPDNAVYKISFYSPAEGYVAFEKNIGYSSDSGRTFSKINITIGNVNFGNYTDINVTFGFEINGIKAFDKNNLIVYGDYGLVPSILYSSNGGNSFTLVYHSQFSPLQLSTGIMDLVFPNDGDTGYAVDADRVLKTTNKGLTWTVSLTSASAYFNHIEAVDKDNLIVMNTDYNANGMRKTSDGGATWSYGNIPYVSNGKITYAYFLDANTGWLSLQDDAQKVYIYKTINGGTNWSLQNNPEVTTFRIDKMRFLDANTGFALVPPFKVYKTLNGGAVWEPLAADHTFTYLGYSNNDLFCLSANQLWAGGGHGFLEMSANGGGEPVPASYFVADTSGVFTTNTVHLNNYSRAGYQYQWYVNNVLVSTSYNATYTHAIASGTDTIQLINTSGGLSDTLTKYQQFFVPKLPTIAYFSPRTGSTGTLVTIKGSNFSGVTGVSVGGKPAASFTVVSDAVVTALLADGATGSVTLIDVHGSYSLGGFTYFPPPSSPPPSVTAFTPLAGIPGTTVTITGSGFGATAGQNGVFFGTIPAVIQSASATSIVCRVPAGASFCNIGVLNKTTGLRGLSAASFQLVFADSMNFTPSSFSSAYDAQPHSFVPWDVAAKDIDGDGKPDVLTSGSYSVNDSMSVYRNISSGGAISFAPKVNVGHVYISYTVPMGVEDLDGDGLPDLAGPTNDSTINIYRNASSPGKVKFDSLYSITIARQTSQVAIADLDNDGKNDLAVAIATVLEGQNRLAVVRNTSVPGSLSFGAPQIITAGGPPWSIAAGDLDGDGRKDLVTFEDGGVSASKMSFYRNTSVPGAISFGSRTAMDLSGGNLNAKNLWIADFDGDGKLDVIISNEVNVAIFRNISTQGAIGMAVPVIVPINNGDLAGGGATLANFTGSGRPDIIVGRRFERMFGFFRNTSRPGTISLDNQITWSYTGINPFSIDAADFDGDGKTDLASVDAGDNRIMVARNTVGVPLDFKICTDNMLGNDMVSDVAGADYQWQMDAGGGFRNVAESANLSNAATNTLHFYKTPMSWNGYKFRCLAHGLYSSTFVLRMTETIHPSLTLTGTDSIICYGKPVTFTATFTDSTGKLYASGYEWQINGKDTGYSFFNTITSSTLHDKDQVRYLLDYYDVCNTFHADSSRAITMQVNETKSSVQVSASDTAVCAGVPVTFTASAINGGTAPTYIWKVNDYVQDGVTGPVFTSSWLPNGARVQAVLNSSLSCAPPAYSNLINMTVKDTSTISVGIKASTDSICEGINVVFTATPGEYMPSSTFEWQVNGTTVGSNTSTFSLTALHDKDKVQCILHVQGVCAGDVSAASNRVEMKVRSMVVPSVALTVSADDCSGFPPIFTAQPVNGGDSPKYGWTRNGYTVWNDMNTYYRGDLMDGDLIQVALISSAACSHPDTVVSQSLTATLQIPPGVLISVDTTLTSDTTTKLVVTKVLRGAQGITYQWQDSTSSHSWQNITGATGPTLSYKPQKTGDRVHCLVNNATGCLKTTNSVAFTVAETVAPNSAPNGYREYPNPVTGTLTIENTNPADAITTITIYDNTGNQLFVQKYSGIRDKTTIDVSSLPKGQYYAGMGRSSGRTDHFSFLKL